MSSRQAYSLGMENTYVVDCITDVRRTSLKYVLLLVQKKTYIRRTCTAPTNRRKNDQCSTSLRRIVFIG